MSIRPIFIYLATGLILMGLVFWHFLVGISDGLAGKDFNKGENAVWARHAWVDTDQSWETISDLVKGFEKRQIKHVYVHAGPINPDGDVPEYRYVYAKQFIDRAKAINPTIQYYAWLGQIRSKVDLDSKEVREKVLDVADIMVSEIGFDGIHYDFETIIGDDRGFISLVKETHDLIKPNVVSIAIEEYIPEILAWGMSFFVEIKDTVSKDLLLELAPYVEQYVIMNYDTKVTDPELYTWLVKQEVIAITRLLPDSKIFMGIPSYDDEKETFHPEAENIRTGLAGIIDGMNNRRTIKEAFEGVAIYANWETDDDEWMLYEQEWLGNSK